MPYLRLGRFSDVFPDIDDYDCLRDVNFREVQPIQLFLVFLDPTPEIIVLFTMVVTCHGENDPVVQLKNAIDLLELRLVPGGATNCDYALQSATNQTDSRD